MTRKVREPAFYSYTAPKPAGLPEEPLRPETANWQQPFGQSHLALLPYNAVRTSDEPRGALLDFLQSAYDAGALLAGWDRDALRSSWCPPLPVFDSGLGARLAPAPARAALGDMTNRG